MAKRVSLTLEPSDEVEVGAFRLDGPERAALRQLAASRHVGVPEHASEAVVLRTLIRLGAVAVRDHQLEVGYAQAAEDYRRHDPERRTLRVRRVARDATRG